MLTLTISLRVIRRTEVYLAIQQTQQGLPKHASKLSITITDHLTRHAKLTNHVVKKQTCNISSVYCGSSWYQYYIFTKSIDYSKYAIVTVRGNWQGGNKIHCHVLKRLLRYLMWIQQTRRALRA